MYHHLDGMHKDVHISLKSDLYIGEIVPRRNLRRFVMMSLAKFLNSLTGFLKYIIRHGEHQPHIGRIIEALLIEQKRKQTGY